MKIIETTFEKMSRERLLIGFEGENLRATVRIDCASVFVEYPNATPALTVKPLFADAYPVVVDRNGTCVDWLITSEILSFTGDGEIQLTFVKDQVICKSAIAKIRVCRSLQVTGDMPDPVAQWVDDANAKLAEVDAQIVELEGMVDAAEQSADRAEQAASTASTKAEQAAGSAATATAKTTEATNAAGTATAKAAEAEQSALTATDKANAAAESERIATAKAGEATTAAGTATAKAEQATEAAQTATEKAGDASASARAAQTSATDAASSATAASASETAAKASETAASTSATQAAQSAQGASADAQTAMQKAAEATQSATNAAASATSAATSAETASTKAGEAAQSAQAVEETAEQLADSLEQIEQNTQDIAELDERKANIDGYYPDMTVGNAEQLNSSKFVENSEPYTFRTSGGTSDIGNREYVDAVVGGTLAWNQAVRDEASENSTDFADIVTVTDAVEDAAEVKVKIEPVQDLHGYSNPWPAGGGKNKFPVAEWFTAYDVSQNNLIVGDVSVFLKAGAYSLSLEYYVDGATSVNSFWRTYSEEVTSVVASKQIEYGTLGLNNSATSWTQKTVSFTTTQDGWFAIDNAQLRGGVHYRNIQLEEGSATDFAPYSNICPITGWTAVQIVVSPTTDVADGQTYDITLPTEAGTVYGGELTINADGSGSLVVDRLFKPIVSALGKSEDSTGYFWYTTNSTLGVPAIIGLNAKLLSNRLKPFSNVNIASKDGEIAFFANGIIRWKEQGALTLAEYNEYLASNPLQICYESAAPITYTLTASEIRTLLGQNNVWADTGDLALTYAGTDEHLVLESGKKYLTRISGTDSMLLGSGQEITAAKGTDNVFDLTKMFGTAVADYVYGQGAAFFRKWFGKQWYPYNTGELKHVEGLQSHDMVGFNAFDKSNIKTGVYISDDDGNERTSTGAISTGWIPVIGGSTYYIKHDANSGNWGAWYDVNKNYISKINGTGIKTAPVNARFMRFTVKNYSSSTGNPDTLCINLAHNNSRNGEYAPYEKHSYPLDSSVILRGIPKVGANGVYWDGDRYLPDGTVERRYGVVDLGTLNWSYNISNLGAFSTSSALTGLASRNMVCTKYPTKSGNTASGDITNTGGKWISANIGTGTTGSLPIGVLIVKDNVYTDAAAFKSAMQGVILVYELATPTTETAQPYHSTQWVSDWGTEEFVSTGIVPVGHETRYPANLRDKLQHLPDAASGNGSYLITQTDGQMVLTPFPAPPSTAGNYVLKATVTGGVATYTWEVAT